MSVFGLFISKIDTPILVCNGGKGKDILVFRNIFLYLNYLV